MIPVLRKVAQLNIKYRKNGDHIIDVCTGAPPDEVTALPSTPRKYGLKISGHVNQALDTLRTQSRTVEKEIKLIEI